MEEEGLIEQLRERNESAYRYLVDTYRSGVFNTILNMLQDEDEADDCAQEVFIQVYHSIAKFRQDSSLPTWLYRIAVRKALDKLRQRKNRARLQSLIPWWMPNEERPQQADFNHPGVALEHKEKAAALFKAIDQLPTNQKIAFNLIKVQGMKYEEVCEIMQQSTKAIESLVMRAKKNLQQKLVQHQDF
ncbi:MAG: RNA polymerase sigma factor [Pedobacter sp.]|nr:RNA polymerase sigma factor [Pedobacter sp.]MDQ8053779.1 RNA polymerase sigma factor [Pedobacter sp.]